MRDKHHKSLEQSFRSRTVPFVLISSIILFLVFHYIDLQAHYREMESNLNTQLQRLLFEFEYPLWSVDYDRIDEIADFVLKDANIVGLSIFSDSNTLISSRGITEGLNIAEINQMLGRYQRDESPFINYFKHLLNFILHDPDFYRYFTNSSSVYYYIDGQELLIGNLYLILSDEYISMHSLINFIYLLLLSVFILIGISAGILITYRRTVTRPLKALEQTIAEASQDLEVSDNYEVNSKNEIEHLRSMFNQLWKEQTKLSYSLTKSNDYYLDLINSLPIGLILCDMDLNIIEFNNSITGILGYTDSEIQNMNFYNIVPEKDYGKFQSQIDQMKKYCNYGPFEAKIVHKSGDPIPVSLHGCLIKRDNSVYLLSSVEDISVRKEMQQALIKSELLLKETSSLAKVGGWEINFQTNELLWTDEVFSIHEVSTDYIPKYDDIDIFFQSDDIVLMNDLLERVKIFGESFEVETHILTAKKNIIWVRIIGEAIRYEGNIIKARGTFQDITNRKEAEFKTIELQKQLNHKSKIDMLGQLAGGVAHDFNNILSAIMSATQLVSMKEELSDAGVKYIDIILNSAENGARLSNKLLTFSRKEDFQIKSVYMESMIIETIKILTTMLDKNITITFKPTGKKYQALIDFTSIQNAILNICINSSHAMPEGGEISIDLEIAHLSEEECLSSLYDIKPGYFVKVIIAYTGHGIP